MNQLLAKQNCITENKYLISHSKMVINIAYAITDMIYKDKHWDDELNKEMFMKKIMFCVITHDIGKIKSSFQKMLNNISYDTKKHNLYSWAYLTGRFENLSGTKYQDIRSAVLYHHAFKENGDNVESLYSELTSEELSLFDSFYQDMASYVLDTFNVDLSDTFHFKSDSDVYNYPSNNTDNETIYTLLNKNTYNGETRIKSATKELLRSILIHSDRLVSAADNIKDIDLQQIINNNIEYIRNFIYNRLVKVNSIKRTNPNYGDFGYDRNRLQEQIKAVDYIDSSDNTMLIASAGSGKTLIGVLLFLKNRKKLTWVLPRNIITQSTYISVVKELNKMGETDVKVASFMTGRIENCTDNIDKNMSDDEIIDSVDILITNIDSILNRNIKNNDAHHLINTHSSLMIFDEYHENITNESLFSAFINLIWTRTYLTNTKTLLMSASPFNINEFLDKSCHYKVYDKLPIHNGNMNLIINHSFVNDYDKIKPYDTDAIMIFPTIKSSQIAKKMNSGSILIHSLFTTEDRKDKENDVYRTHDKNSCINDRGVIIGTNIIGTGLDVSAHNMIDFPISPEDTIQRIGRLGRFGEYSEVFYDVYETNERSMCYMVNTIYTESLHKKWISTLKNSAINNKNELYDVYYKFLNDNKTELYNMHMNKLFESNAKLVELKPYSCSYDAKNNKLSSKTGFRGVSTSVWCAVFDDNDTEQLIVVDKNKLKYIEDDCEKNRSYVIAHESKYGSMNRLKYAFGMWQKKHFTIENLCVFATDPNTPVPLFNARYDKEYGLVIK